MRKMLQLFGIALGLAVIDLTNFLPSDTIYANSNECFSSMSEETTRYVREMGIPLKGADAEFYSSETEQVFLLSSDENLKLNAKTFVRNTVAVIDHRDAGGKSSFYVIEQDITPGNVTFLLKKDSKVLQSLRMKLIPPSRRPARPAQVPGQPCQPSDCAEINRNEAAVDAIQAAIANQTCTRQLYCVEHCECFAGELGVAQTTKIVDPTSRRCWRTNTLTLSAHLWLRATAGPLLTQAWDAAIKKEAKRYRF